MPLTEHERGAYARAHPIRRTPAEVAFDDMRAHVRRPARWAGLVYVVRWLWDRLYFRWAEFKARRRIPHG